LSQDHIWLALYGAKRETGATDEMIEKFKAAIDKETDKHCMLPKGFL